MLATIEIKGDTARVRFAFNPVAVRCVRTIPGRLYEPNGKYWSVPAANVAHLEALLRHEGFDVQVLGGATSGGWAEAFVRRIGCDSGMFKRMARALHPDTGGDGRLMQELNVARARCCGRGK